MEEVSKGLLADFKQRRNLLVSFGGISQGLGIPVFEFFRSISKLDIDKLFIRDFSQAWYHKGIDSEINHIDKLIAFLDRIVLEHRYESVCFIGNSMGAYGSILFGSILNVNKVIAFAPQTYIDEQNRSRYRDTRWAEQIIRLHEFSGRREEYFDLNSVLPEIQYETEINIFYSPLDKLDKIHAERLNGFNNIRLHPVFEGGHAVVRTIRDKGILMNLIQEINVGN